MYLIVIAWSYQKLRGPSIEIQQREEWSDADVASLETTRKRERSWDEMVQDAQEFFLKNGLTIEQVRECFQDLPVYRAGIQSLANFLKMPVIVYATPGRCQTMPEFRYRCDPVA